MSISYAAPISGVTASSLRMDNAAHTIANLNTPNFSAATVNQVETLPEGTRIASISKPAASYESSTTDNLLEGTKEELLSKETFTANLKVIKAKDKMVGELLDLLA